MSIEFGDKNRGKVVLTDLLEYLPTQNASFYCPVSKRPFTEELPVRYDVSISSTHPRRLPWLSHPPCYHVSFQVAVFLTKNVLLSYQNITH